LPIANSTLRIVSQEVLSKVLLPANQLAMSNAQWSMKCGPSDTKDHLRGECLLMKPCGLKFISISLIVFTVCALADERPKRTGAAIPLEIHARIIRLEIEVE
jgi:hypothetical protein